MGVLNGQTIGEEAVAWAAKVWAVPENSQDELDVKFAQVLADAVSPVMQERDNWIETAIQNQKNADYWQGQAELRKGSQLEGMEI